MITCVGERVFVASSHQTYSYHHFQVIMPRQPLAEISANSTRRDGIRGRLKLTPHWRSHIIGRSAGGQSSKTITDDLRISLSIICSILSRDKLCYENESLHRIGRPDIVNDVLYHYLLREVRANSKITYKNLRLNLGLDEKAISKATLYRVLKKEGIVNWLAKKRP